MKDLLKQMIVGTSLEPIARKVHASFTRDQGAASTRSLRNLEIHITHSCNLGCESCSHYSNQHHKGMLSVDEADHWMSLWAHRLDPKVFSLLGGEPTIHPDLPEFVMLARRHWPRAKLRIATNGFFLYRHPTLPLILGADPDACLYVSIHHGGDGYRAKLQPTVDLLQAWVRDYGIRVVMSESFKNWTRRYKGFGAAMEPFEDERPRQSWKRCPAKYCPQLFEGRIWKCAPLAYLGLQNTRYGLSEKWRPYLS
jgi:Radical SAM superfamily/4Fe-4S single cluster domain